MRYLIITFISIGLALFLPEMDVAQEAAQNDYLSFQADPRQGKIQFFWKDEQGNPLLSLGNLKRRVERKQQHVRFAMNGGMYMPDHSPQGLYIEQGKVLKALNTQSGTGNFYWKPNGIFYVTNNGHAGVCVRDDFKMNKQIQFATQSGPMLVIDEKLHPEFKEGSTHRNIRNGVGILPNGQVLFVISKYEVSLFEFARYFQRMGCKNALYLDGFVSRCYYPEMKSEQLDGDFGVMIGVLK